MERRRMVQLFEAAEQLWGSFDDFPALPPGIDPMPHLSRNTISQPFFLVSDQDQTLINLSGEGAVWFGGERPEQLQLAVGDSVYIPAGIPSQVITHTPSVQVRFKAETPGKEAVVWYCPDCRAVVHWRSIDTQAEIPQAAYWQAVQQFNTDPALRVCPACQSEHPRAELGNIAWPAVAQAISEHHGQSGGRRGMSTTQLLNFVDGEWSHSSATESLTIPNPATAQSIAVLPVSPAPDVDATVQAATRAFPEWRRTPAGERIQYLFKFKTLLEEHLDELAQTITNECGKTYTEAAGEMRRGIENVEVACGIPSLLQGLYSEDIARGIDETMIRQPVGVVAAITPFNFPGMIPLWFLPYAIACGNTFILKPSDKTPLTAQKIFALLEQTGLPKGVANLVNGAKETVDVLVDHPEVRAISLVGSTPVAKAVYARATANGKRAQCQGGAKNPIIVLPDANIEDVAQVAAESAFGCAGQRCLAASLAITVGDAAQPFVEAMADVAVRRNVGYGLDAGVEMGPVIRAESKARIEQLIQTGLDDGAQAIVDGRQAQVATYEQGYFVKPTILTEVQPGSQIATTEIFGPVLSVMPAKDIDAALSLVNGQRYGNMACLFTQSGAVARKFRYEAQVGNLGINVGVAAPMAFFPFSGWKDSFFGDLHGQGRDAIDFYTEKKVIVERWG